MKNIYFITFVILLPLFIACSSAPELEHDSHEKGVKVVYEVFGMDCPGCQGGLEKLLTGHEDILAAKADWVQKKVIIYLDENYKIREEEIFELIKNANFTPGKLID